MLKRKPWVSEELEGKDESEYLGISMDTAKTPSIVSGESTKKTMEFVESIPVESSDSRAKAYAPSSATHAEQTHVVERQQPDWAMGELANNHRSRSNHFSTHHPGLIPDMSPTGATDLPHRGHVPLPTAPNTEAHPDPYHGLYPPPPSQQYLPPPSPVVELTPSIIAKAQKHCRFAISSLDYEDADQARKELRAALAILGDT
ncbi:hypothetical protein C0992_002781 [Termitomyces sp. T32_za158]|nr:hypothetical protein C0992_002781 [Termitomyces sp. T32_za158]